MATVKDHQYTVTQLKNVAKNSGQQTLKLSSDFVNNSTSNRLKSGHHKYTSNSNNDQHELPKVCSAMRKEMLNPGDKIIRQPPSG